MNQNMLPVFFWLCVIAVAVWLLLSSRLVRLLKAWYPKTHASLGKPGTLLNTRKEGNNLWFLFCRSYRDIPDPEVERLCDGLLAIGVIFLV